MPRPTPDRRRPHVALMLACGLMLAVGGNTETLVVDPSGVTPWPTIQSAVDDALSGDDVLVRCGRYVENVVLHGGVSLRGERPGCVTVDGDQTGAVVTLAAGEPQLVDGLTLRNGFDPRGGGIVIEGGSPVITRNVIVDNGARVEPIGYGAGYAGGIYVSPSASPMISRNVIRDNRGAYTGGIMLNGAYGVEITSNLIAGNVGYFGGGVYSVFGQAALINNTIVENYGGYAGGIWAYAGILELTNNVVAWNECAGWGSGGGIYGVGPDELTFRNNDFFENLYGSWPDPFDDPSTFAADPLFVDRDAGGAGGFQPRSTSPLVDAGTGNLITHDLRGIPVPQDGDADGVARPDVGARENEGVTGVRHDGAVYSWDRPAGSATTFNVYRGELETLERTGVYTQDPLSEPGAEEFCRIGFALRDPDLPEPGGAFFYLVTLEDVVEGSLGFDSGGVERTRARSCHAVE